MNNRQIDRRQFVRGGSVLVAAAAAGNVMAMQQSEEQPAASQENGTPYLAGVKSAVITPEEPIPMAGFGSRGDKLSEGVYQDLIVKTLVLSDRQSKPNRLVIVTADLVAWSGRMIAEIREKLKDRLGLGPESIMLNASHTHCGPALRDDREPERAYVDGVIGKTVELVETAFAEAEPARVFFGRGRCDMSRSRRCRDRDGYFVRGINPYGHTDTEVGILKVARASGKPLAVLFNYACHPTSIGGFLIGGDWAGYAHRFVESKVPGATALFMQGCGGDLKVPNRHPDDPFRFGYGGGPPEAARWAWCLVNAVTAGLARPLEELSGEIVPQLATVELPLVERIDETDPEAGPFTTPHRRTARLAKSLLGSLDKNGNYRNTKQCEVMVARIGRDFVLAALNGEMAVRIGLRIKEQLIPRPVIVAAYTNAVYGIGYVPSANMIPEEGYEAYTAYSLEMEDFLVREVMTLAGEGRTRPGDVSAPRRKRAKATS